MSKLILIKRFAWGVVAFLVVIVAIFSILIYKQIYSTNIIGTGNEKDFLYIPTGATFEDLIVILDQKKILINENSFRWAARQMNFEQRVKPGKYQLKPKMNNKDLISLLRSGKQIPVNVIFIQDKFSS